MAEEPTSTEEIEDVGEEPKAKASVPWIPLVLVLLFIPIITLVIVQFVLIPQLKNSLAHPDEAHGGDEAAYVEEEPAETGGGHGGGHGGGDAGPSSPANVVVFEDIIANVAGTMGTRFLKVSFQIEGESRQLSSLARTREAQVRDAIISTLSSRTIQEIEVVGGRNALRIALISAINEALGNSLVDELYFLDFIIQ